MSNFLTGSEEELAILEMFPEGKERSSAKAAIMLRRESNQEVPLKEDIFFYRVYLGLDRILPFGLFATEEKEGKGKGGKGGRKGKRALASNTADNSEEALAEAAAAASAEAKKRKTGEEENPDGEGEGAAERERDGEGEGQNEDGSGMITRVSCPHGNMSRCKDCGGHAKCAHNKRVYRCRECYPNGAPPPLPKSERESVRVVKEKAPKQPRERVSRVSVSSEGRERKRTTCPHGKRPDRCYDCGGHSVCEHRREKNRCRECGGSGICTHGRRRTECRECGGASICEHGKRKWRCKDCNGASICTHGKEKNRCRDCGGASICVHDKARYLCAECKTNTDAAADGKKSNPISPLPSDSQEDLREVHDEDEMKDHVAEAAAAMEEDEEEGEPPVHPVPEEEPAVFDLPSAPLPGALPAEEMKEAVADVEMKGDE
uniref:Uncharacterized protein n=1 Tax=Chromera velia CCMP2878 TaxID=1169474 RepID=A0A0G4FRF1_9ALVE|eukprot:Cvel_3632.t1-p1 / transcript=Cvel_3632.t1 / gene=Cvel_3632 / organism=Chromera_velia_CCMP2878 / gene_product=hypothetical protein / transcript_product=hypothetical protein / location=Cvel_scaffold149:77774-79767(+) / protein_length=431 / sequence_SO=supercontig / SO=protein_coding / is_pseudo=false